MSATRTLLSNKMFVVAGHVDACGVLRAAKSGNHAMLLLKTKNGLLFNHL
ncbi:Uncharacterised protein [Vibrio cholerae]|nr:Uncharacterised protein [Vibrio cholerae]